MVVIETLFPHNRIAAKKNFRCGKSCITDFNFWIAFVKHLVICFFHFLIIVFAVDAVYDGLYSDDFDFDQLAGN